MVVVSAVTAAVIGRALLGRRAVPAAAHLHRAPPPAVPPVRCAGVAAGFVGVGFTRVLYGIEDLCDAVVARPGMAASRGRRTGARRSSSSHCRRCTASATRCSATPSSGVTRSRCCSCCWWGRWSRPRLTIGIGGSGGVFAPSLFIGAMLGSAFGAVAHASWPSVAGAGRGLRAGRDGRRVRRRVPGTDHRGGDHVRADRRVLHHLAADDRHRAGHRDQPPAEPRHDLLVEATTTWRRPWGAGDDRARPMCRWPRRDAAGPTGTAARIFPWWRRRDRLARSAYGVLPVGRRRRCLPRAC